MTGDDSPSSSGAISSSSSSFLGLIILLVKFLIYSNLYLWMLFSIPYFLNINLPGKYLRLTFGIQLLKSNDYVVFLLVGTILIFKLVYDLAIDLGDSSFTSAVLSFFK